MIAIYGGDSADVAQQHPHNSVCVTALSQNGKSPQGNHDRKILEAHIQNTTRCQKRPSKAREILHCRKNSSFLYPWDRCVTLCSQFQGENANNCVLFVVLHPCLRSHWFAVTADSEDATAQEEAISTAEVVFKYVAETYLDMPASRAPTVAPKPSTKPVTKTPSFLASACSFQRPVTTSAVTISKCTPQEDLANELKRYLNFEAAPVERQEGEEVPSDEPSAHDVLLDPLLWWKVSTLVRGLRACILLTFLFRYMLPNFLPLLGWLGTILPFPQQVSLSNESSQSPATFAAISAAH